MDADDLRRRATLEEPLEFVHEPAMAQVTHREIGPHASSFVAALHSAAREDMDKARALSAKLFDEGVFALPLGFPTVPKGKERLRTIVTAGHTLKNLEFAVEKFKKADLVQSTPRSRAQIALAERRITAASLLEDSSSQIQTSGGLYIPQNYDRHFKGWTSLRMALGNSYNVPAVRTIGRNQLSRRWRRTRAPVGAKAMAQPPASSPRKASV